MNPTKYTDSIFYLKDIGRLTGSSEQANAAAQRGSFIELLPDKAETPNNISALLLYGSDVNFNIFYAGVALRQRARAGHAVSVADPRCWCRTSERS